MRCDNIDIEYLLDHRIAANSTKKSHVVGSSIGIAILFTGKIVTYVPERMEKNGLRNETKVVK